MSAKRYYKVKSYASSSGIGYCFYCQIYDENKEPIMDHNLNDRSLAGKGWATIRRMMNRSERRCKLAGIERIS